MNFSFVDRGVFLCSPHFLTTQGFGSDDAIAHQLQHLCDMFPVVINKQDPQNWKQKTVDRARTNETVVNIQVTTVIQIDNQEMNSGCKTCEHRVEDFYQKIQRKLTSKVGKLFMQELYVEKLPLFIWEFWCDCWILILAR